MVKQRIFQHSPIITMASNTTVAFYQGGSDNDDNDAGVPSGYEVQGITETIHVTQPGV